jgi:hypothetical protein
MCSKTWFTKKKKKKKKKSFTINQSWQHLNCIKQIVFIDKKVHYCTIDKLIICYWIEVLVNQNGLSRLLKKKSLFESSLFLFNNE